MRRPPYHERPVRLPVVVPLLATTVGKDRRRHRRWQRLQRAAVAALSAWSPTAPAVPCRIAAPSTSSTRGTGPLPLEVVAVVLLLPRWRQRQGQHSGRQLYQQRPAIPTARAASLLA
jgi:hypothetical protein